jgi:lipopolysaccharide/colanic/teichoic acid biosynthesis glycosyltransferase
LYYIDHWSFFFDLQIIAMTFLSKEAYSNAY